MMKILTTILVLFLYHSACAQILPADTVPALIKFTADGQGLRFSSELRALRQIAGAPEPFYNYFWEFGDGKFSFEQEPLHLFADTGLFDVRLYATNNYDDGKRPPTRPKPIKIGTKPQQALAANKPGQSFLPAGGSIALKTNCMPKPGDDMMLVLGYKNKPENGLDNLSGTVSILYNDKEFAKDNFELAETRVYHKEQKSAVSKFPAVAMLQPVSSNNAFYASAGGPAAKEFTVTALDIEGTALVNEKISRYRKTESWKFDNLKTGEERFMFMHFRTTPEMIKDTNATVRLTAVFIPDNPLAETEFFDVELQIVASHDPNKMILRNSRMNYRFTGKNRKLTYKVRFQNTGKGPAKKIDVGVAVDEKLDRSSIRILDSKPKVILCDLAYTNQSCLDTLSTPDSVHFIFKNIYLPGLKQKGVNDADSTMGYIEYSIGFKEKPKKLPIKSGAAIVFDKNEPIYTNRATGRYKTGLSPAIIAGYGFPFADGNTPFSGQKNITFGVSIAPFAPHRYYLQAELYMSSYSEKEYLIERTPGNGRFIVIEKDGKRQEARLNYIDSSSVVKVITINAVPLHLRYNFNKFIGAGAGALVAFNLNKQSTPISTTVAETLQPVSLYTAKETFSKITSSFNDFQTSLFADVQVGKVYVGPSIGFRYLHTLQNGSSRLVTYLTWKF